jgi:hypothetical protein
MIETLLIGGLVGLAVALVTSLIALKIQYRVLDRSQVQQQAWERAQLVHLQQWQQQQEKRIVELEQELRTLVHQVHTEWRIWQEKEASRAERVAGQYARALERAYNEHEVARLPHVDWIPLSSREKSQAQHGVPHWQAAKLQEADLSHRDLSQRYLGRANLRDAYLVNTNLYMSNLTGACLIGANLTGANLIGANLTETDLSGAILTGDNLLVADLNNAVLIDANLIGVRNLTIEQVRTALYDTTTQFDPEIELNLADPEASPTPSLRYTAPLTQQSTKETSPASSPLSSSDSLDALKGPDLPADRPENRHTEEPGTKPPTRRGNGRKRAKVN